MRRVRFGVLFGVAMEALAKSKRRSGLTGHGDIRDRAFEWIDRAFAENDPGLSYLNTDPLVRKLRGDPRYAAMLAKLNLPLLK